MNSSRSLAIRLEWRAGWPIPIICMLGMAGAMMFSLASGVLLTKVTTTFGWSRSQFFSGLSLQMLLSLLLAPLIGWLIQRYGPRSVALIGIWALLLGTAAFALTTGSIWQWRLLCALLGFCMALVSPAVWVTVVVGRFDVSRGLAIAVALAGLGAASIIWPLLVNFFVQTVGWRAALFATAVCWALPMWPLCYFMLERKHDPQIKVPPSQPNFSKSASRQFVGDRTFVCLIISGSLFAAMSFGINVNLVPMLQGKEFSLSQAASLASFAGLAALFGRIGVGHVLDRFSYRPVGVIILLLPAVASMMFLYGGSNTVILIVAAVMFGLAAGGEADLVAYVASRRLPPAVFPSAYALIMGIFGVSASMGPLLSGLLFDWSGSYKLFLLTVVGIAALAVIVFLQMPTYEVTAKKGEALC